MHSRRIIITISEANNILTLNTTTNYKGKKLQIWVLLPILSIINPVKGKNVIWIRIIKVCISGLLSEASLYLNILGKSSSGGSIAQYVKPIYYSNIFGGNLGGVCLMGFLICILTLISAIGLIFLD